MTAARCLWFRLSQHSVHSEGGFHPLVVPVHRCILAESLTERLRFEEDGTDLASYMQAPDFRGEPRIVSGPDLETVSTQACTRQRC
jgi:hypothetical protein